MYVKVSKRMIKELKKEAAFKKAGIYFDYYEMPLDDYRFIVTYDYLNNIDDYDYEKEVFKVIRVSYEPDYYACNKFLTTSDLLHIFRSCNNKTWDSFINDLYEVVAI